MMPIVSASTVCYIACEIEGEVQSPGPSFDIRISEGKGGKEKHLI